MIRQLTIGAGVSEPYTRELSDNSTCNKLFSLSLQPTVDGGSHSLVKPLKDFAGKQEVSMHDARFASRVAHQCASIKLQCMRLMFSGELFLIQKEERVNYVRREAD